MAMDDQSRYEQEKKVAETYATIGSIMRQTWKTGHLSLFLNQIVTLVDRHFDWQTTAVLVREEDRLVLGAWCREGRVREDRESLLIRDLLSSADLIATVVCTRQERRSADPLTAFPQLNGSGVPQHYAAYPLINRDVLIGVLLLGRERVPFDDCETEILRDLAEHVALAMDNIAMYEERKRYVIREERNRLAKDLHDSVNQKLFTISLMAQGLADVLDDDSLRTGLADIGELARESLAEMKALIWDLRSAADGRSLPAKIKAYAEKIGLHVQMHASLKETDGLDDRLEEELWRVAQEALNNVRKHAGTDLAAVTLHADGRDISLEIVDRGRGFRAEDHGDASEAGTKAGNRSFGLTSMRERAVRIRGTIRIASQPGQGTTIRLTAPIVQDRKETGLWR